jgi:hypothetical protein
MFPFARPSLVRDHAPSLLGLAMLALAPAQALAADEDARDAACPAPLKVSSAPMIFARQLRRSLFDGKELVVTRHYRIQFRPVFGGFSIDGTLLDTQVEAPPRLAALAAMEKAREDDTIFPIQIDTAGRFVAQSSDAKPILPDAAQNVAGQLIRSAGVKSSVVREQANGFVEQLFSNQGPVISQWPESLFRPGNQAMVAREELALPGGGKGKVTIMLTPKSAGPCGLIERLERTVETEVGAQRRRTQEIWSLSPAP